MSTNRAAAASLVEDAGHVALGHEAIDPADVVAGDPTSGLLSLHEASGVEIGIWEITPGTVTDVEVDEMFVVLSGRGRVEFADGSNLPLSTGSVVLLRAGDRTTWFIEETVRKIYVVLPQNDSERNDS